MRIGGIRLAMPVSVALLLVTTALVIGGLLTAAALHDKLVAAMVAVTVLLFLLAAIGLEHRYRTANERRSSRAALHLMRERAEVILESIGDAVITVDNAGRVEYLNPVAERLTAWRLDQAVGRPVEEVFRVRGEGGRRLNPVEVCLRQQQPVRLEGDVVLLRSDGVEIPINDSVSPIRDHQGEGSGAVIVFQDVADAREMARRLQYQASHDHLTGLYNRRAFEERLTRAISRVREGGDGCFLCYMDLDQFKLVNDTAGHLAGDALLQEIAGVIAPRVPEPHLLARLGGDEFGLLLEEVDEKEAVAVTNRVLDAVRHYRFVWEGRAFEVGVSVGIVPLAAVAGGPSELLALADSACYLAKEQGGNRIHVHHEGDSQLDQRLGQMNWVYRITEAFAEQRFVLFAQAIRPLLPETGLPRCHEILLRMRDDEGNLIPPSQYVAAAERYRRMPDIDRWVVVNAFRQIHHYVERSRAGGGEVDRCFAINLSGQSLGDDRTLRFVEEWLERYPGLAGCIVFEVTETAAISSLPQARRFIMALRERGCRFSLDDFGTGFSSFSQLRNLPVDFIKIDGAFVRQMAYDPVDYAMVASINQIGHLMGIKTIAEYVESEDILQRLAELGVDYGQGNWLSPPVPLEEVLEDPGAP
ncbi:MAG TPA: EAL domain-containing protein [Thiotrichales bacterium]|nr:EAL domain-containing protein [Thiotrichales bacterium]